MTTSETRNYLAEFVSTQPTSSSIQIVPNNEIPSGALVVKSLVWTFHRTNPVLIVLDLTSSVDKAKLAQYLELNHVKHLRMATPEQVLSTTGQIVGNVSPIGHVQPVRTIIDQSLLHLAGDAHDELIMYGGGGSAGFELKLTLQDLLHHSKGEIADVRSVKAANTETSADLSCDDKVSVHIKTEPVQHDTSLDAGLPAVADGTHVAVFAKQVRDLAIQKEGYPRLQSLLHSLHTLYSATQPELFTNILNTGTSTSGKTALHLASWKGSIDSVKLLLHYGADVNAYSIGSGNYGKTAIFYAITQCRDDVVCELLTHHACVKIVNNKGQTPRSLGPSHLAEATICRIEEQEVRQKQEWLNFYTTHYCDTNTCFGDLDPRFQPSTTTNHNNIATNADTTTLRTTLALPMPRSINTTTFEFRRNHFQSYTKKAHHIDSLVVSLLRSDKPITNILTEYVNTVDCTTINLHLQSKKSGGMTPSSPRKGVQYTNVEAETFVGYVASVSTCQDKIARLVPITQYLHTHSHCALPHPHALKWKVESQSTTTLKTDVHKIHYEYLQLHSSLTLPLPTLSSGDIVIIKGTLDVTHSALICTPTSTMVFQPTTTDITTTYTKKAISSHKVLKKAAKAKRAEKSNAKALEEEVEINVITGEATLNDLTTSFVPLTDWEMGNNDIGKMDNICSTCTSDSHSESDISRSEVSVTVVDSIETLLQFDADIQSLLRVAHLQNNTTDSSISINDVSIPPGVEKYIAANPSRLYTVIGLDCEWRPGEVYLRYLERQKRKAENQNVTIPTVVDANSPDNNNNNVTIDHNNAETAIAEDAVAEDEDDEFRVAILQIATRRGVYLLDMQELTTCMFNNNIPIDTANSTLPPTLLQLNRTLNGLFASPHILKLGFKVAPDFEKLAASYPFLTCFTHIHSVMDTCTIAQLCVPVYVKQGILPAFWTSHHRLKQLSLTKLLAMVLGGKGLSKEQQCSRWHLRPLTSAQVSYGALDAASLLTILDYFTTRDFAITDDNATIITTQFIFEHKLYRTCVTSLKYHVVPPSEENMQIYTGSGMALRSLLGVQIVAQSWTLQQDEPIDYTVYAQQQEALQTAEGDGDQSNNKKGSVKFKKLSELYVVTPAVTEFIRQYKQTPLFPACGGTTNTDNKCIVFLDEYISSSKDTCVEFVQALRNYEACIASGDCKNDTGGSVNSITTNDGVDASPVVSKMQNGMALVEDIMVIFVNFPAAVGKNKGTNNNNNGTEDATETSAATDSLFLHFGKYVKWSVEVPGLVRENSSRVGTMRSLLLHNLVSDKNTRTATQSPEKESVTNSIVLFVRQNAAPYVYCGRVSVSSLCAQLISPNTQVGDQSSETNTLIVDDTSSSTGENVTGDNISSNRVPLSENIVLDVTLDVQHFDTLYQTKYVDGNDGDSGSLYKSMILRALGAL